MTKTILHALNRFGLGRLGAEPLPDDPHVWLAAQLESDDPGAGVPLPSLREAFDVMGRQDRFNEARRKDPNSHPELDPAIGPPMIGATFRRDAMQALRAAVRTTLPARERLVLFWTNHFAASAKSGGYILALSGPYVQEAIRPHATGRFVDLLRACLHHPTLLLSYAQQDSVGPNSPFGLARKRGLNENLARETLELFTLGLKAGYTQDDVTAVARLLTGFGIERAQEPIGFRFRADLHEPGPHSALGRTFSPGEAGSEELIAYLGTHPATYRHIADKLVRHYIADAAPPSCVDRVAARLTATQGDITAALLEIAAQPEAWQPFTKLRTPLDHAIALHRALALNPGDGHEVFDNAVFLGEAFWSPPLVKGWPDAAEDWTGGEALLRRADLAWRYAGRPEIPEALPLAERLFGGLLSDTTRQRVARAPTRRAAVALLLASPEFMRR